MSETTCNADHCEDCRIPDTCNATRRCEAWHAREQHPSPTPVDWQAIAREWQAKYYEALRASTVPMPPLGPDPCADLRAQLDTAERESAALVARLAKAVIP